MIVDCDTCVMHAISCGDCVITALLGADPGGVELSNSEQDALGALASGGLIPPLRLVPKYDPNRHPGPGGRRAPLASDERAG